MIVVGASLGGLRAVSLILSELRPDFRIPIVVALHRAKDTPDLLTSVIQTKTLLRVLEVNDKDPIERGCVHIAPPDYHLLVNRGHFSLSIESPVNYARPSIDVLFESAADLLGPAVTAVVLTGASADGAAGAAAIAERGGAVIVQTPKTAESPVMPEAALRRVPQARVLDLPAIATLLNQLTPNV